ncbi:MAG: poly-gamma-glutamate hydrolase family protein [Ilumatobacteraceae bacterium]
MTSRLRDVGAGWLFVTLAGITLVASSRSWCADRAEQTTTRPRVLDDAAHDRAADAPSAREPVRSGAGPGGRPRGVHARESRFGFMAFHGGELEAMTDVVARRAADLAGASWYVVRHPADQAHFPSIEVDPAHSLRIGPVLDHVEVVVTVHGFGRHDMFTTLLLGARTGCSPTTSKPISASICPSTSCARISTPSRGRCAARILGIR